MPKTDIDYQKTIIYKIVCNDLSINDCYVGHTTDFNSRKARHKHACYSKEGRKQNYKIYKIIRDNGGWDNWTMVEIEKYPCNDRLEASSRERFWYEDLNSSLNTQIPYASYCRLNSKCDKSKWIEGKDNLVLQQCYNESS